MPSQEPPINPEKPWVAYGSYWAEHEGFLVGNKEGLSVLRDNINAALDKGESRIECGGIEIVGVRVVEQVAQPNSNRAEKPWAVLGCGLVVFFFLAVFLSGLYQIWNWLQ
jgi:hypothetical protein